MSEAAPTPPGPNDASLGAVTEQELDDVLTRASVLAADATQQVGTPEAPPSAAPFPSPAELSATLDDELSRLDGLVSATASEVGSDLPSSGTDSAVRTGDPSGIDASSKADVATNAAATAPKAGSSSAAASNRNVPDFMLEFTEPATEAPAKPSSAATAPPARAPAPAKQAVSAAPVGASNESAAEDTNTPGAGTASGATPRTAAAKPGIVGTGMLGVVSTSKDEPTTPVVEDATAKPGGAEAGTVVGPSTGVISRSPLSVVLSALARFLEILDRPFARLGDGLKELIGWIALATLGTALVVYLIRVI